jgi:thiol-disulfide isomerase/thioredoxin
MYGFPAILIAFRDMHTEPVHATQKKIRMFQACFDRAAILVALCAVSAVFLLPAPLTAEKMPRPAELSLQDTSGKQVTLRDLRGKIVVLNFWATWCGPCKAEMPMVVKADEQYKGLDVAFVGVSLDDVKTQKNIPAFLNQYRVTYAILIGASADDLAKLKMGIAVPATAFIDRKGRIRFRILGQMRQGELQDRIDWLLRESTDARSGDAGPAPPALVTHLEEK